MAGDVSTPETPEVGGAGGQGAEARRNEGDLLAALCKGDERAFTVLVERYHVLLVNLALSYVGELTVAEEVAQETWLEVVRGVHRFEGRSTLKTWLCAILANRARTRAVREERTVPFSTLATAAGGFDDGGMTYDRFDEAGWWASSAAAPRAWAASPEDAALAGEVRGCLTAAIADLPSTQRQVITLRDVQGCSAMEVCNILGVSETNQRVLLHRARSRARGALERYFREGRGPAAGPELP
jgi:RNA polymerase sigma-70 factor, ECF subfamily